MKKYSRSEILPILGSLIGLRHGKADPAVEGAPDSKRQLSALGMQQAAGLARSLEEFFPDGFNDCVVLSSGLDRAVKTTQMATGVSPLQCIEFAVSDSPTEPINVMFELLKYAPLISGEEGKTGYFQHELAQNLRAWGFAALDRVMQEAQKYADANNGKRAHVVVGGHAVMTNALMFTLMEALQCGMIDPDAEAIVVYSNLNEAEALCVFIPEDGDEIKFRYMKPIMEEVATAAS